jgi:hypothetical protein
MSDSSDSTSNVKIDITANADGVAPGAQKAAAEMDKLGTATANLDKKYSAAVESSEKVINVTNRTAQQFVTLGKEVVSGDTNRIPGTLARIAMGFGPIGIAVGAVTGVVAAGVWAWMEWGDSAEKAANKVADELKKAEDSANRSKHKNTQEQIQAKQDRIEALKGEISWVDQLIAKYDQQRKADPSRNKELADQIMMQAKIRGQKQADIDNEIRNIQILQAPGAKKDTAEKDRIDATIAREQAKYNKLHEMAAMADATDVERIRMKLQFDLQAMEKEHEDAKRVYGKNAALEQEYQDARIDRVAIANAEVERLNSAAEEKAEAERQRKMRADLGVANFSKLLRQGDYVDAMTMAQQLTAGLATKSRAAFEINKAASLAKATVQGYQAITAAFADGMSWGSYYGAIAEAALAAVYVGAQIQAINSTQFGGGGNISTYSGGVPSQSTSPGVPVTPTSQQQQQPVIVNIYNQGNLLSNEWVESTIIPQIKDSISNSDVILIDPRSRQAQMLGAR